MLWPSIGIIAAQVAWENDWLRVRGAIIGYVTLAILQLLALARYPAGVTWTSPVAILYLIFLLTVLAGGAYIYFASRRPTISPPAPGKRASLDTIT